MAGEPTDRRFWTVVFLASVDFCCVLLALERYDKGDIKIGTAWLVAGVVSSVIGWKWPRIKQRIANAVRRALPEDAKVKLLETECAQLKERYDLAIKTSDTTQQENRELRDKVGQREERIGQILEALHKSKLETDEIYADVIFSWLRDRFHSTGRFSAAAVAQSLDLPEDSIRRGLGLLKSKYQLVTQELPDVDMWTFVAGLSPLVPKFKIVPTTAGQEKKQEETLATSASVSALAFDLFDFLKSDASPAIGGREDIPAAIKSELARVPRMHDAFMNRFHSRLEQTIYALGEIDLRDWKLNEMLSQSAFSDTDIRMMAGKLLELRNKLELRERGITL